jgi:hypothetical protein
MCLAWPSVVFGREHKDVAEQETVEEVNGQRRTNERNGGGDGRKAWRSFRAAQKLTSPLLPVLAVVMTALMYIILEKAPDGTILPIGPLPVNKGVLASIFGLVIAFIVWTVITLPARKRATARESSPPNYYQIMEALDNLKYKIRCVRPNGRLANTVDNGLDKVSRCEAYEVVRGEIREVEKRLKNVDTAWVTGAGYIELWHRIHRAQEAMIKLEPLNEVVEGAMRDDERLLDRLRSAVAVFEVVEANGFLRYLPEGKEYKDITELGTLNGDAGALEAGATKNLRTERTRRP